MDMQSLPRAAKGEGDVSKHPDVLRCHRDDWVAVFVARVTRLGAREGAASLMHLAMSIYQHYDLLDPHEVARVVWRRWPHERKLFAP